MVLQKISRGLYEFLYDPLFKSLHLRLDNKAFKSLIGTKGWTELERSKRFTLITKSKATSARIKNDDAVQFLLMKYDPLSEVYYSQVTYEDSVYHITISNLKISNNTVKLKAYRLIYD